MGGRGAEPPTHTQPAPDVTVRPVRSSPSTDNNNYGCGNNNSINNQNNNTNTTNNNNDANDDDDIHEVQLPRAHGKRVRHQLSLGGRTAPAPSTVRAAPPRLEPAALLRPQCCSSYLLQPPHLGGAAGAQPGLPCADLPSLAFSSTVLATMFSSSITHGSGGLASSVLPVFTPARCLNECGSSHRWNRMSQICLKCKQGSSLLLGWRCGVAFEPRLPGAIPRPTWFLFLYLCGKRVLSAAPAQRFTGILSAANRGGCRSEARRDGSAPHPQYVRA